MKLLRPLKSVYLPSNPLHPGAPGANSSPSSSLCRFAALVPLIHNRMNGRADKTHLGIACLIHLHHDLIVPHLDHRSKDAADGANTIASLELGERILHFAILPALALRHGKHQDDAHDDD